jgi:hypothetical protein
MFNSDPFRFSGVERYVGKRKHVEYVLYNRVAIEGIAGIKPANEEAQADYRYLMQKSGHKKGKLARDLVEGVVLTGPDEDEYLKLHPHQTIVEKVRGDLKRERPSEFFEYAESHNPDPITAIRHSKGNDTVELYGPWTEQKNGPKSSGLSTPPEIPIRKFKIGKYYHAYFSRAAERHRTVRDTADNFSGRPFTLLDTPDTPGHNFNVNPFKDFDYSCDEVQEQKK